MNVTSFVSRLLVALLFAHAAAVAAATPDPAYVDDLSKFRKRADASLTRERGWLSIVSRDELAPGTYKIGSAKDNQIVLPKDLAPAYLGTVTASKDKARLVLARGNTMQVVAKDYENEKFTERDLVSGATRLEWVTLGRLSLQFVKRDDGKIVVRAADRDSAKRKTFPGRVWYDANADYKVPAKFVAVADGATIPIANVRGEISYEKVAGTLEFTVNGQKMTLDALDDDDDLFIIFRDGTSNSTTYPPGRFLVVEKPKDGKSWVVDFNKAYNPPCAVSEFTTCPTAPRQNVLKVRVEAGEKYRAK